MLFSRHLSIKNQISYKGTTKNAHTQENEHFFRKKIDFIYQLRYYLCTRWEFTHKRVYRWWLNEVAEPYFQKKCECLEYGLHRANVISRWASPFVGEVGALEGTTKNAHTQENELFFWKKIDFIYQLRFLLFCIEVSSKNDANNILFRFKTCIYKQKALPLRRESAPSQNDVNKILSQLWNTNLALDVVLRLFVSTRILLCANAQAWYSLLLLVLIWQSNTPTNASAASASSN